MLTSDDPECSPMTTFVDSHYIHIDGATFDGVAETVVASGLRAVLGRAAVDGAAIPEIFREEPSVERRRNHVHKHRPASPGAPCGA